MKREAIQLFVIDQSRDTRPIFLAKQDMNPIITATYVNYTPKKINISLKRRLSCFGIEMRL